MFQLFKIIYQLLVLFMVHTQFPSLAMSLPDVQNPMKRTFTLVLSANYIKLTFECWVKTGGGSL